MGRGGRDLSSTREEISFTAKVGSRVTGCDALNSSDDEEFLKSPKNKKILTRTKKERALQRRVLMRED